MISQDYPAGEGADNELGSTESLNRVSNRLAGWHDADFFQTDGSEPPPECKAVRLEPKVCQLLESMGDAVIAHDSGVIIGFNQRVPPLLGCPGEKILWRRLSKFIEPISLPTLIRWIEASDRYTILVNGVRSSGDCLLLRLEAVASLVYPGGRRVEVVALIEFAPRGGSAQSRNSD